MPVIAVVITIILIAVVIVLGQNKNSASAKDTHTTSISREQISLLTRDQLIQKIKKLESTPAPMTKMGAMCYKTAMPPNRAEYICPNCHEKTLYSSNEARFISWGLDACRREFDVLKTSPGMSFSLDESSFCSHCSPSAKVHALSLTITFADGKSNTTSPVSYLDIRMLAAFVAGKDTYDGERDSEISLKENLPRLKQLLGITDQQ